MKKSELQNVLSMFLTFFKSELRCSYKMCSYKKKECSEQREIDILELDHTPDVILPLSHTLGLLHQPIRLNL